MELFKRQVWINFLGLLPGEWNRRNREGNREAEAAEREAERAEREARRDRQEARRDRQEVRYRKAQVRYQLDPSEANHQELASVLAALEEYEQTLSDTLSA